MVGTGQTEPFHCSVAAVGKVNSDDRPMVVASEFICSRLAMVLGLPVPAGGLVTGAKEEVAPGGLAYVSLNFYPEGERPPPADPQRLSTRQWDIAGLAVFDAWITCQDRHLRNIVFEPELGVPLTVIDFDQSVPSLLDLGMGARQLVQYRPGELLREPHALVTDAQQVKAWIDRVMSLPRHTVQSIVGEAVGAAALPQELGEQVTYVLTERARALPTLFKEDWEAGRVLTGIEEWGLV